MKSGILGGTFDPPHRGHLEIAVRARSALALDRVFFVPAYRPPHKQAVRSSPFSVRWEMLRAAIAGRPGFVALDLEREREGPSYTADTLERLRTLHPEDEFWLIVGADSLVEMPEWRDPERIARLARIAVYPRSGSGNDAPDFLKDRVDRVPGPLCEVSSSEIRARVKRGASARHLVPPAVWEIIRARGLYRSGSSAGHAPDGRTEEGGGS